LGKWQVLKVSSNCFALLSTGPIIPAMRIPRCYQRSSAEISGQLARRSVFQLPFFTQMATGSWSICHIQEKIPSPYSMGWGPYASRFPDKKQRDKN